MLSTNTEGLLGQESEIVRFHRRVVGVSAVAAWLAAVLILLAGLAAGDGTLAVQAIAWVLVATITTAQILLRTEDAGVALLLTAAIVIVSQGVAGSESTLLPAAVALVIVGSLAMLFVERHRLAVVSGSAFLIMVTPAVWGIAPNEAIGLGLVMTGGFVLSTTALMSVLDAASKHNRRLHVLFDRSPTAVLEEDWSDAIAYVRSEYAGKPHRIRPFLLAYPEVVRRAVALARVRRANSAAMELLEVRNPGDILGNRDGSKVTPENLESFVDALVALYEGHGTYVHEFATRTFRGRRIWLQARAVDDTMGVDPKSVLVALADISHLRAREESIAESINAKNAFIASISHELRTPLTAVLGLSYEMTGAEMPDPERDDLMRMVTGQAEEMAYIVEDLLVAARSEIGTINIEPSTVDLGYEVAKAVEALQMHRIETPGDLPRVYADPMRTRQILRNLLTNVERYGGPERRIVGGRSGDRVWIEVRDNGPGVGPLDVERIFNPYATAHSGISGSVGLGLSVARQLADLMGGSLAYMRDGVESVFRLELPVDQAVAVVSASGASSL